MIYTYVGNIGKELLIRERNDNREGINRRELNFQPSFFFPDRNGTHKDIHGKYLLKRKVFDSIQKAKNFLYDYTDVDTIPVFGMGNYEYQYIQENYPKDHSFNKSNIRVGIFDIEVASPDGFPHPEVANYEVNAITYHDSYTDTYTTWGLGEWFKEDSELKENLLKRIDYVKCSDERDLLTRFVDFIQDNTPDILSGWNSNRFDCLYIVNRINRILDSDLAKNLSPFMLIKERSVKGQFKKEQIVDIVGINQLDYLDLYRKHTFKMRESYKLDHIAHVELDDEKLSYDEVSSLHELYLTNYQKYIDYNIKDVDIVVRLDAKLKLFHLVLDMAWYAGVNLEDTYSPVRVWDGMVYDDLLRRNVVIPLNVRPSTKAGSFMGAYVKEPIKGLNKWVVSFDLTSLYPSIMQQWNLGPETIITKRLIGLENSQDKILVDSFIENPDVVNTEALKVHDCCIAANGTVYSNGEDSFMKRIMKKLFDDRKASKNEMLEIRSILASKDESDNDYSSMKQRADGLDTRQAAMKVLANSGYGAMGNQFFRFFDIRIAEAVTYTGQLVEKYMEKRINQFLNESFNIDRDWILAMDTDSIYIDMNEFIERFGKPEWNEDDKVNYLDKISKYIQDNVIDNAYEELRKRLNCSSQLMIMKREVISSSSFWKAKKKYAMLVLDSEGVRKEKVKVMGLESISSKTPSYCREGLTNAIELILKEHDEKKLIQFNKDFRKSFFKKAAEDIAIGSGVNGIKKYSDSNGNAIGGSPWHVKASLLYNSLKKKYNIVGKSFPEITSGMKVKLIHLKEPNPTHCNTIAFPEFLPREFKLDDYVDYEAMFEKGYLSPLRSMCETFGYNVEEMNDISDFFE